MITLAPPTIFVPTRRRSRWGCLASIILLVVLCCIGQVGRSIQDYTAPQPSARKLQALFQAQQPAFTRLVVMMGEDVQVERLTRTWMLPTGTLSKQRWDEYRELCALLSLQGGIEHERATNKLVLIASLRALGNRGASTGYVYTPVPPQPLVDNLDEVPHEDGQATTLYQHLDGDWYLFYTSGIAR
jgi:hypothetical protein